MSMKKKKTFLVYFFVFLLISSVYYFWTTQKRGFFTDETLSIKDTNIADGISKYKTDKNALIPKGIYTGKELKCMYLWNDSSIKDVFRDIKYLYIKNENRVHTNLYYSILRLWFVGVDFNNLDYSIKTGITLNFIFFCFAYFFMYKLLAIIFDSKSLYIVPALLIAFLNTGTISNFIFMREYFMQMMFFIILTYFILKNIKSYKENENYNLSNSEILKISAIIALTNNSGYFSIFYVILLLLYFAYYPLSRKDVKMLNSLIKTFVLSIIFTLIIYPLYFTGFFSHHGTEIYDKFGTEHYFINGILLTIDNAFFQFINYIFYYPVILLLFILIFIPLKQKKNKEYYILFLISLLWLFLTIFFVREDKEFNRYIIAILPILSIFCIYLCKDKLYEKVFIVLFLTVYLYGAIYSPCTVLQTPKRFYYSVVQNTYQQERQEIEKIQGLNLPIVISEEGQNWDKFFILPFINDNTVCYINSDEKFQRGQKYILIVISNYLNDVINKYGNPDFYVPLLKFSGYFKRKE